jgi:hypothetical protein
MMTTVKPLMVLVKWGWTDHKGRVSMLSWFLIADLFSCKNHTQNHANITFEIFSLTQSAPLKYLSICIYLVIVVIIIE